MRWKIGSITHINHYCDYRHNTDINRRKCNYSPSIPSHADLRGCYKMCISELWLKTFTCGFYFWSGITCRVSGAKTTTSYFLTCARIEPKQTNKQTKIPRSTDSRKHTQKMNRGDTKFFGSRSRTLCRLCDARLKNEDERMAEKPWHSHASRSSSCSSWQGFNNLTAGSGTGRHTALLPPHVKHGVSFARTTRFF